MEAYVTSTEFHQKVGVPFLNVLLREEEAVFDMESIEPVKALLALDPSEIPTADNAGFVMHGSEKLKFCFHSIVRKLRHFVRTVHCRVLNCGIWWLLLTHRNKARL